MHWSKTPTKPEYNKDIFFYDEEAGFLAGYLDEMGRFVCRADGFSYDNVTHWAYASITYSKDKFDVVAILNDTLINKAELAKRIWPGKVGTGVRLNNKVKNIDGQRLTEKDIDLINEYLKGYFNI